jgi:hypothetical protein
MNYKDALNVSIDLTDKKLTRAKLAEIASTLQGHCLLFEVDKPTLISPQSYIKDVRARWAISQREIHYLIKDVTNVINYIKDKYNLIGTLIAAK